MEKNTWVGAKSSQDVTWGPFKSLNDSETAPEFFTKKSGQITLAWEIFQGGHQFSIPAMKELKSDSCRTTAWEVKEA